MNAALTSPAAAFDSDRLFAGGSKQRISLNSADSTFQFIRDKHVGAIGSWLNEQARNFHSGYKGSKASPL